MKILVIFVLMSLVGVSYAQFPQSYEQSRNRFRLQCQKVSGDIKVIKVESATEEDLTVDVCRKKSISVSEKLIILTSGIHGPEAYVGAVAQQIFLESYWSQIDFKSTSVVLIHALNPYGYKTGRRVSEQNIDLNRNLLIDPKGFKTIKNKGYEKFKNIFNTEEKVSSISVSFYRMLFKIGWKLLSRQATKSEIRNAVGKGQYSYKKKIYFGGTRPTYLKAILDEYVISEISNHKKTVFMDFHTGLGDKGVLHILTGSSLNEKQVQRFKSIFFEDQKKFKYKLTLPTTEGFYETTGDIIDYIYKNTPKGYQLFSLAAEFGTKGTGIVEQISTLNILSLENQGHQYGYVSETIQKKVKKEFKEIFLPADKEWRSGVIQEIHHLYSVPLKKMLL